MNNNKVIIPCNFKSRQLLFKIIDKIKKKEIGEIYIYFTVLLLSWISVEGSIFKRITQNTENNFYEEDNFATFLKLWIRYFTINNYTEWSYENFIDEQYINAINNKKIQIMESLNLLCKITFFYDFKNNLINYNDINYTEIVENIKSYMIDIYSENIYYKSCDNDYSFINYKNNIPRCVISNSVECSVYLGKPKYYLFSFKTQQKSNNFYILDKIIDISNVWK